MELRVAVVYVSRVAFSVEIRFPPSMGVVISSTRLGQIGRGLIPGDFLFSPAGHFSGLARCVASHPLYCASKLTGVSWLLLVVMSIELLRILRASV
uniref:Uncharacterized protein n=1 Tax=Heterorhabditis bacteriophora TaxID=37862 RepID=A0A1I7XV67_HETBA